MINSQIDGDQEKSGFERGFEAGDSGNDAEMESMNEADAEDSEDSGAEAGGDEADQHLEDENSENDSESDFEENNHEDDSDSGDDADLPQGEAAEAPAGEKDGSRDFIEQYFGSDPQSSKLESAFELVEIPEEIKAEAKEILKVNPQYENLLLENSEDGQRFRANLYEFGPEAAIGQLESAYRSRQTDSRVDSVVSSGRRERLKAHYSEIRKEHPDYIDLLFDPERTDELKSFSTKLTGWAEELPFREASEAFRIIKSGTSAEVSGLLTRYKEATSRTKENPVNRVSARDVIAVPGKRKPARDISTGKTFESGFDAAVADENRKRRRR
ncbi:hypothetical protein [Maridesulfovibrio bastinii]|uniref:hypothetical protein n=1 Tax=Maridesulfovibrio bastinii TaxID=47157 RepID=UPI00041D9811|nr:hypothetical protein [Maridesulfovibrio bastinii]